MLSEKAAVISIDGVWETFEQVRERLNLQNKDPVFVEGSGLSPSALKSGFYNLRDKLVDEAPVIRKAKLLAYLLLNGRILVDPEDWFADKLDHQNLMEEYNNAAMEEIPAVFIREARDAQVTAFDTGYYKTGLDVGHVSPGWRYTFAKGISGLLEDAKQARSGHGDNLTAAQADFYDSLEIVYTAISAFSRRLSDMAASLVGTQSVAADARLLSMADSLQNISEAPPADFHEALQFALIMHNMIELEGERVRSMGGFDRNFFTYYDADYRAGKLTIKTAQELIKFFFTKFYATTRGAGNGKNFYFGGQYADGTNAENELTYITLEAYHEMNTTDPKLSVRFHKNTTDRLYRQVTETIRAGRTSFVLINDEIAIPAIMACGKTLEEAREYLLIGCYEPTIEGKEISCNMSTTINFAKTVELVISRGIDIGTGVRLGPDTGDPNFSSYEAFENAYFVQLHKQIDHAVATLRQYESQWPLMNPSPVLAGTFEDALKKGCDIGQRGPKYNNTGCMGSGIATASDSLAAVKKAVFDDKILTMQELAEAIYDNFEGHEKLHRYLLYRTPKWGNANPEVDVIAKRIVDTYCARVNAIPNNRGGRLVASLFSISDRYTLGKGTSALPDGRKKGEPLSQNNAASRGMDKEGVTAYLQSATSFDYTKLPNGSVSDVYLHPSAIKGEDGLNALISLIKTYFKRGGFGIQFNIFDTDTLIDAKKHPEKYQTLQIRVCGWNVYFVTMSPSEQEQYINANVHSM